MPSLNTIGRFVAMVEAGHGMEALSQFYAEHASMQENKSPPRAGKEALLQHERSAQASVNDLRSKCIAPILVSGNVAVIRWLFEYNTKEGKPVRFEELAYQRWENELIVQEPFFYDPAQFR